MAKISSTFHDLDSLLLSVPQDKALCVPLTLFGSEFDLTRDEAIKALKGKGFFVAGATGWLAIARTEKLIADVVAGADMLVVRPLIPHNKLGNTGVKDVKSRKSKANVKAIYTGPLDPEDAYDAEEAAEDAYDEEPKRSKPNGRKYAVTAPEQAKEKRPTYMGYNGSTHAFALFYSEAEAKKWKKHELAERPYAGVHIGKIIQ